jgi:hypothetical protein
MVEAYRSNKEQSQCTVRRKPGSVSDLERRAEGIKRSRKILVSWIFRWTGNAYKL